MARLTRTAGWLIAALCGAGNTGYVQYLSRDPGYPQPNNISLSEAMSFVIRP